MSRHVIPLSLILSLMLVGCASSEGAFPSLAPRPIERTTTSETSEPVAADPPAGTLRDPQAEALIAAGEEAHAAFLGELAAIRPTVAGAADAAPGGEAWVSAQQALSRLDAMRGSLASALTDLDALRREAMEKGGHEAALEQGAQRLAALAAAEDAAIAELARALR